MIATNGVQLNTLVESISVESTQSGDIFINEATGLIVDKVVARDGSIQINAGNETLCARCSQCGSGR